jgi:hypothetical protein
MRAVLRHWRPSASARAPLARLPAEPRRAAAQWRGGWRGRQKGGAHFKYRGMRAALTFFFPLLLPNSPPVSPARAPHAPAMPTPTVPPGARPGSWAPDQVRCAVAAGCGRPRAAGGTGSCTGSCSSPCLSSRSLFPSPLQAPPPPPACAPPSTMPTFQGLGMSSASLAHTGFDFSTLTPGQGVSFGAREGGGWPAAFFFPRPLCRGVCSETAPTPATPLSGRGDPPSLGLGCRRHPFGGDRASCGGARPARRRGA